MRPWLPLCAILALGCSEAPPGPAPGPGGAIARDGEADVVSDVVAARDALAVDAPDAPDASSPEDRPRPVDAGSDASDAGADVPDAAADAAADASEVSEVSEADAPQADDADVAVAPEDAGPVVHPLDPPPATTEVRVMIRTTCHDQDGGPCGFAPITTVRSGTCSRTGSRLNFTFNTGYEITGLFPDYRGTAGATIAVVGAAATQGRDFVIEAGPAAGRRQSFRVSFSAPATPSVGGVTGVPGRTLTPERGDVWLLGCEVR